MFEKITLRRSDTGTALTPGDLAEALLYHQNVHLLLDRGALQSFVTTLGADLFLSVLDRPEVTCTFTEDILGVITNKHNGMEVYDMTAIQIIGAKKQDQFSQKNRVAYAFELSGLTKSGAKKAASKFLGSVSTKKLSDNYFVDQGIPNAAKKEADDTAFLNHALAISLAECIQKPELSHSFRFDTVPLSTGIFIADAVDWAAVNSERKRLVSGAEDITRAHLLSYFLNAVADLHIASHYGGEYITSAASSKISKLKYANLLKRIRRDSESISEFQEAELDNGAAIRDCINSGARTFAEFLKVIDTRDASHFRKFWAGVNTDENALKAYYEENSRQGWIASIPSKSVRLAICTTASVIAPPVGMALSASDSLLLEKMLAGWRPNHFVEKRVKPFVGK